MRAVYLRLVVGSPSRVLKFGTYNNTHNADDHYPCMLIFDQPINEQRFRQVLTELAAEAGIPPEKIGPEVGARRTQRLAQHWLMGH